MILLCGTLQKCPYKEYSMMMSCGKTRCIHPTVFMTVLLPEIVSPQNSISEIRESIPFNGSTGDTL